MLEEVEVGLRLTIVSQASASGTPSKTVTAWSYPERNNYRMQLPLADMASRS